MSTTFIDITLNLQKKYNKINELQDVTKQMAETLQRNDLYAFQLLMKMRTKVMLEIDSIDFAREDLLNCLAEKEEELARTALNIQRDEKQLESPDLQQISDISKNISRSLQNTIQNDKGINHKIGGENSFYKK